MGDDGNFWDPYCPCKITRKNIVMTFLCICCFALTAWTLVVTGQTDVSASKNVSYILIDDTKAITQLNITLTSQKALGLATAANERKAAAINAVADKMNANKKTTLRTIRSPTNNTKILCQCMCDLEVTSEEMMVAMQYIVQQRRLVGTKTTIPTTTTPAPEWRIEMSYRDLRSLTEMMRALGYPRLISLENFRQPNFQLVAEMLSWLVKRFEPTADLPMDIDTPDERVMFVRSIVQFMATKAHVKLHAKKIYQSDGYAVKEIIKVTSVLYNAMRMNNQANERGTEGNSELPTFDISSKLTELKQTRQLGSQITMKGAALYDLLSKEVELRDKRNNVLSRQLEIAEVEQALKTAIKGVDEEIKKVTYNIDNVASNEANLESKIEKKKVELERNQKRLLTLKKVRPAFMDEYEKMEDELRKLYEEYIVKFRCMTHLEQQIEEYERVEQEKMKERHIASKKIMERMHQDESMHQFDASSDVLSDDLDSDDDDDLSPSADHGGGKTGNNLSVKPRTNRPHGPNASKRVFGSMVGDGDEDSGSLDSDSDLILDGQAAVKTGLDTDDDDDDDELEVNEMASESLKNRKSAKPTVGNNSNGGNSDDDF